MILYERLGRSRAPTAENDNWVCAFLILLQQDHLHNEPSTQTRGIALKPSYLESPGVAAWGELTLKVQHNEVIHGLHCLSWKHFGTNVTDVCSCPQLSLQSQFALEQFWSALYFHLRRKKILLQLWYSKFHEEVSCIIGTCSMLLFLPDIFLNVLSFHEYQISLAIQIPSVGVAILFCWCH